MNGKFYSDFSLSHIEYKLLEYQSTTFVCFVKEVGTIDFLNELVLNKGILYVFDYLSCPLQL